MDSILMEYNLLHRRVYIPYCENFCTCISLLMIFVLLLLLLLLLLLIFYFYTGYLQLYTWTEPCL
jgi:hypothetical protein